MAGAANRGPDGFHELARFEAARTRLLGRIATCIFILTIIASALALWLLRGLVTPLIVAIFLLILVDALSRQVAKVFPSSPEWSRLSAAFVLMTVLLSGAVWMVIHSSPKFAVHLSDSVNKVAGMVTDIAESYGVPLPADVILDSQSLKGVVGVLAKDVKDLIVGTLFVVIYLGFLLASRPTFRRKAAILFPEQAARAHAQRVFARVRSGAEGYIGLQTFKAVMLAAFSYCIMAVLGLHDAAFLAFLILLVAYVPLVGPALGVIVPVLLALAQFGLGWRAAAMYVLLQALVIGLDNILLPRLQGEKLDVDPVVVLLSLGFWSLILGVPGALLSTPLTVVVISIAAEAPGFRWLAVMLSRRGGPAFQKPV